MKIDRTGNAIRNTKWGFLQKLVNILFPFIVRTVLIYTLNAEYAGLSSLFTSILSILSLTELGFSNAIVYSMYRPVAEDDKETICALLNVYRKAYFIIGLVILGLGLLLLPLLPHLIKGETPADTNLYILYVIYLINNVISYFLYGYKTSLLSAYQREDIVSKNTLFYNVFLYSVQCVVLLCLKDYYAYVIVIPIATIILNLLNNKAVTEMFPEYKPKGSISKKEKDVLRKNIIGLMIWKVGGATRNTFDSIVASMYLGLVTVAIYNNYFYIVNGVTVFLGVLTMSITAGIGNKIATESPERNYEDFTKFQFYYMWIAGWCTVCMLCLYQPFMRLWMGENLMFPNRIMYLFCYYFMMMKQGDINSAYYQAAGLWWEGKMRSLVEAVLNLGLNIILGKHFGVAGILLATIISWTCVAIYGSKFVFTKYFKNGMFWKYWLDLIVYMFVTAFVGFCSYQIMRLLTDSQYNNVTTIIIGVVICLTIPNVLFFLIYGISRTNRLYMKKGLNLIKVVLKI